MTKEVKIDLIEDRSMRWPDGCERTRIKDRTGQEAVPEVPAKEVNHHIAIALRHLNERRKALLEKRAQQITAEIEELNEWELALE